MSLYFQYYSSNSHFTIRDEIAGKKGEYISTIKNIYPDFYEKALLDIYIKIIGLNILSFFVYFIDKFAYSEL
jgi:hypothetical protein